jgi:pimeloyl-ACP methyl ester carboxylesterase
MPELRLAGGSLDGLAVHYVSAGRGPAVVLVHGLGGFAESWRTTIDALAARATVFALDLPGFGQSSKSPAPYDLSWFATVLRGFIDAIGVGQAALVGHSLGGAVAATYALIHPARVERLALLAAVVPGAGYRLSRAYRALAARGIGEALALCGCRPLFRAALARCFHRPVRAEVDFLVDWCYGPRTGWDARAAYLATLRGVRADFERRGPDYRRALRSLDQPVLLIHGTQDPVVPAEHCRDVASVLPRAAVRWIEACGHFPQIEHAQAVNEWLVEFLVGRPAAR